MINKIFTSKALYFGSRGSSVEPERSAIWRRAQTGGVRQLADLAHPIEGTIKVTQVFSLGGFITSSLRFVAYANIGTRFPKKYLAQAFGYSAQETPALDLLSIFYVAKAS
ncbi:hypothetical protein ACFL6E_02845 [Candidatus Neomarinimicrobiota bacterium]